MDEQYRDKKKQAPINILLPLQADEKARIEIDEKSHNDCGQKIGIGKLRGPQPLDEERSFRRLDDVTGAGYGEKVKEQEERQERFFRPDIDQPLQ
jgi:hypothetical protein